MVVTPCFFNYYNRKNVDATRKNCWFENQLTKRTGSLLIFLFRGGADFEDSGEKN
jgi:hypothetical protein